jgi:nucleoside-diphosphate-sugar epimerase
MRTLIIGANGYVGSRLVDRFVGAGHDVSGLVRSEAAAGRMNPAAGAILGDLDDLPATLGLLDDVDAVIFAAQLLLEPEFRTVSAMLERLEGTGKHFIFTSGTGVLSQRTGGEWSEDNFSETDIFVPSKYIGARKDTEDHVRAAADRGVKAYVVRPPLIWGHGGCPVIRHLYQSAAKTGTVCYLGRGLSLYSNVHVDDLTRLYLLVIERGVPGRLYHAVSGEANYRTLAEGVARALGIQTRSVGLEEACEIWGKATALIGFSSCSRSRAPLSRRELGWTPSPEHLDIMDEVAHPAFLSLMERGGPRPAQASAGR